MWGQVFLWTTSFPQACVLSSFFLSSKGRREPHRLRPYPAQQMCAWVGRQAGGWGCLDDVQRPLKACNELPRLLGHMNNKTVLPSLQLQTAPKAKALAPRHQAN